MVSHLIAALLVYGISSYTRGIEYSRSSMNCVEAVKVSLLVDLDIQLFVAV